MDETVSCTSKVVHFPDGTEITASPLCARSAESPDRDFGLYMDPQWAPTWPAELIDWPDFGLPSDPERATAQIRAAFERAASGESVEVGCTGGLGRTGTVLACMAVLAGVPVDEAVAWVHANYAAEAIETRDQEAWIGWFARRVGSKSSG
jgi:hypothetical protein